VLLIVNVRLGLTVMAGAAPARVIVPLFIAKLPDAAV
jgi:hypothetical protein